MKMDGWPPPIGLNPRTDHRTCLKIPPVDDRAAAWYASSRTFAGRPPQMLVTETGPYNVGLPI